VDLDLDPEVGVTVFSFGLFLPCRNYVCVFGEHVRLQYKVTSIWFTIYVL